MMGSRWYGSSADIIGYLWDTSLSNTKASIFYNVADIALQRLTDYSLIMAIMRDLIQGNNLAMFISISAKNKDQFQVNLNFSFALLILYTHLIGVNAIAANYRDRIAADPYLTDFFENFIGPKYTNSVEYYTKSGSSSIERLTGAITDTDYKNLLTHFLSICESIALNIVAIAMYAATATLIASITSTYNKKAWYSKLAVSPEMMLGYSTWKHVIDFSVFASVIGEGMVKKFTDINADEEFWVILNPMIDIYWTFLYVNILMTMEYAKIHYSGSPHSLEALNTYVIQSSGGDHTPTKLGDRSWPDVSDMKVDGRGILTPEGAKNFGAFALSGGSVSSVDNSGGIQSLADWEGIVATDRYSLLSDVEDYPTAAGPGQTETRDLWMRYADVTIESAGGERVTIVSNMGSNSGDCDVDFKVEAGNDATADVAVITLWNLSQATKDAIISRVVNEKNEVQIEGSQIKLRAGYKASHGKIFEGYVWDKSDVRSGADVATVLTCYDKIKNFQIPNSFYQTPAVGTPTTELIAAAFQAMSVETGHIEDPGTQVGPMDGDKTDTVTYSGTAATVLDDIVNDVNSTLDINTANDPDAFTWFIRDAKAYFVRRRWVSTDEVRLSADTGLIEAAQTQSSITDATITVKCLLTYQILTAVKVTLDSTAVTGSYGVRSYTHTSQGSTYYTEAKLGVL